MTPKIIWDGAIRDSEYHITFQIFRLSPQNYKASVIALEVTKAFWTFTCLSAHNYGEEVHSIWPVPFNITPLNTPFMPYCVIQYHGTHGVIVCLSSSLSASPWWIIFLAALTNCYNRETIFHLHIRMYICVVVRLCFRLLMRVSWLDVVICVCWYYE